MLDLAGDAVRATFDKVGCYLLAVVEALLVLLAARVLPGLIRPKAGRALSKTEAGPYALSVVQQLLTIVVYVLALSIVLAAFGASWSSVLAFFTVTSIALALASQDVLKNLLAGFCLLIERPFAVGETIRVKEQEAVVERVALRSSVLRTGADDLAAVPNATLFSQTVVAPATGCARRLSLLITGLENASSEARPAILKSFAGARGLGPPEPRVAIRCIAAGGAEVAVTIWHGRGDAVAPSLLARLHERFPDAEIAVEDD